MYVSLLVGVVVSLAPESSTDEELNPGVAGGTHRVRGREMGHILFVARWR